jgi:hypothetical protein
MSRLHGETVRATTEQPDLPLKERRHSPRFTLRDARAIARWDEGSEHITCEVEVLNISGGGAAVLARRAPPVGASVRLELNCRPAALKTVEARSLAISV